MTIKITKITAAVSLAAGLLLSSAFADTMTSTTTVQNPATATTMTGNTTAPVTQTPTTSMSSDTTTNTTDTSTVPDAGAIQPVTIYVPSKSSTNTTTTTTAIPAAATSTPTPAVTTTTSTSTAPANTATAQPVVAVSQANLMDFAQKAVLAAFSYDYQNYQQSLQKMQSYFTKSGWDSFNTALTSSNNLDVVQKEKLTVIATLNGQTIVTQDQQTAAGQIWQVTVPVIVTYQNAKNQNIKQDLTVKLAITTVSTDVNPLGLGIDQFIAMPTVTPATTPAP